MRSRVIGQTGRSRLSDDNVLYTNEQGRIVRYQFTKTGCGWIAWICQPFHSQIYGSSGFGVTKLRALSSLQRRLERDCGYIGKILFSDADEADTIGQEKYVRITEKPRMRLPDLKVVSRYGGYREYAKAKGAIIS